MSNKTNISNSPILFCGSNIDVLEWTKNKIINIINDLEIENKEKLINRINNDYYADFSYLNGNNINKSDILNLENNLYIKSIEQWNLKFYLISNLDKCSIIIQNSLLKFIEQPPKNTFAFFSFNNLNNILKTIQSRCEIHKFNNIQNKCSIDQKWKKFETNLFKIFDSKSQIDEFINSELSSNMIEWINNFNENIINCEKHKIMLDFFKKLDYKEIEILLKLLIDENDFKTTNIIFNLLNDLRLNLNKTLIFSELLKLKE